ncbi:aminodeoxychorismate synthase component I [Roseibium aggregatum]|uniref:aminodeoxychorismate synthase component I n=1 Tax=Roseibium aggregatum TaxID=187304 RepID=UPI001AD8F166|nr:aminodeoxychorismate synthase component I [Roseibium aggregatum]
MLLDALKARGGLLFRHPERVITTAELDAVPQALEEMEQAREAGAHLAGFLAYELGFAFEDKLKARWRPDGEPLLWFGVYDAPQEISLDDARDCLRRSAGPGEAHLGQPRFGMDRESYDAAFTRVQDHLAMGDIYQVNLTLRAALEHRGAPEALFLDLLRRQPVGHGAFLKLEDRAILSLSPELFLEREGRVLRTRPMKGTAGRGVDPAGDRRIARELAADPKQRAENIMIVDLMRNDLSRIAETGSVRVSELCTVERYKSLHQMTSTVEADLGPEIRLPDIIARLFPCGSITGAPKLSAMQIAHDLETGPRGVYTGSIGHVAPTGDFRFNVAIRTLVLKPDGSGEVGTGSGVIFDSGAAPEYDECALKLKFMTEDLPKVGLIETMAFLPEDGYLLLDRHMARLTASADYFGYPCDEGAVRKALEDLAATFKSPQRVRLELTEDGDIDLTWTALQPVPNDTVWDLALAGGTTRSSDRFLYHKTTNRAFYDDTRKRYAEASGCHEVLFENEDGYLTEGSFTTLFVQKDERLLTPALRHGLLPGTLRAGLLERGLAAEADLRRRDLEDAQTIYVGNSVRGLIRGRMVPAIGT